VDVNKVRENDRKVCDNWAGSHAWADDPSLFIPRNIRIGDNNTFIGNFQGSIAENGRWVAVRNNTFTNDYITYNTNSAGGTMTFGNCADTIQIYHNLMTGPNNTTSPLDEGLELYGRNIYVQDNTIQNYPWAGVGAASTYNLFIENNNPITNNSTRTTQKTGGVLIEDLNAAGCDQPPRDTQSVTISGNTIDAGSSQQPDGVKFGDRARNTIDGVSISGNIFSSYSQAPIYVDNPIVIVNGTINGNPCPGASCATTGSAKTNDPPRALAPDATGPIVTARCSTPGAILETFTFEAADVQKSSNVHSIEVMFSPKGPNDTPAGPNNGLNACHFVYSSGVVYLAGSAGGRHRSGPPEIRCWGREAQSWITAFAEFTRIHRLPP
jgi:hypothetical protein